jgi:hypothetical protein
LVDAADCDGRIEKFPPDYSRAHKSRRLIGQ